MDIVSSLECLKFDSQSEFLYKDSGRKDLFSPAMVPINCETSIIRFKDDESKPEEYEDEEFLSDESEAKELIGSNSLESEADESESDELEPSKLIGHECEYCLQVGDHFTQLCPYKFHVPKNAIVSTRCVILCNRCGCHFRNSCCASCGRRDGCAVIMDCLNCGKKGEHMTYMCPNRKRNSFRSHTVVDDGVVSPLLQIHRPKPIRSKADESEADESEADESETDESEADESETEILIGSKAEESEAAESEADEMETDDADSEKLIGTQQAPSMVCSTGATTSPCQSCSLNCLCEACLEIAQSKICESICD